MKYHIRGVLFDAFANRRKIAISQLGCFSSNSTELPYDKDAELLILLFPFHDSTEVEMTSRLIGLEILPSHKPRAKIVDLAYEYTINCED